jgi:hypothetical protein
MNGGGIQSGALEFYADEGTVFLGTVIPAAASGARLTAGMPLVFVLMLLLGCFSRCGSGLLLGVFAVLLVMLLVVFCTIFSSCYVL